MCLTFGDAVVTATPRATTLFCFLAVPWIEGEGQEATFHCVPTFCQPLQKRAMLSSSMWYQHYYYYCSQFTDEKLRFGWVQYLAEYEWEAVLAFESPSVCTESVLLPAFTQSILPPSHRFVPSVCDSSNSQRWSPIFELIVLQTNGRNMESEGRKVSEILIQQQNTDKQNKTHRNSHLGNRKHIWWAHAQHCCREPWGINVTNCAFLMHVNYASANHVTF